MGAGLNKNIRNRLSADGARNIFPDIERAAALWEQISCADLVLKFRVVDQAAALIFGIPLHTPKPQPQPVVDVLVALIVDDGAVHFESPRPEGRLPFQCVNL
jgi:hypothetical protein